MSHRALALKYRPQRFSDLVGQDHVATVLERAVESGRAAHAYLFTGPRGVGKTTTARILAKALNCERRASGGQPGAEPCNACTSCTEITAGVSLDVAEIDGASNRGIADVQALREKVRFSPTGGRHRVVIIDEVHQLSNDAFAALLKTLEEPPPHLVFVFATTDPQKLPDTIRSRTQRFDFARVPLRKLASRLEEIARQEAADPEGVRFGLTAGAALLLAQKSEGSVRDAVSALDQVVSSGETPVDEELVRRVLGLADREAFFGLAEAILGRDPKAALAALHGAFEKGLDASDLAQGLSEHLRHLLILKVDPTADDLVPAGAEDLARMRGQAEGWSEPDLMRLLRLASECTWPMRDSPQPLIHLEAAVLQMATLEPGETLAELLRRLEALEQRLTDAVPGQAPAGARGTAAAQVAAGTRGTGAAQASTGPGARPTAASAARAAGVSGIGPGQVAGSAAEPAPEATGGRDASRRTATLEPEPSAPDSEGLALWEQVIAAVNERKRMLGAFLQESQFLGLVPHGILLGMDDLHRAVVDERENRTLIAGEVARVFGRPLALRYTPWTPGARPQPPSEQDLQPLIERAITWFEGDLVQRPASSPESSG